MVRPPRHQAALRLPSALLVVALLGADARAQSPPPEPAPPAPSPTPAEEPPPPKAKPEAPPSPAPKPKGSAAPAEEAEPTPDPEKAVTFYDAAMAAMAEERYGAAAAAFEKAYEYDPDPVLVWNIGYAREKNGELGLAKAHYTDFLAHEEVPGKLRKKAHERVLAIEKQLREEQEARQAKAIEERLREELKRDLEKEAARKAEIERQLREDLKKELQSELQAELDASQAELDKKRKAIEDKDKTIAQKEKEADEAHKRAEAELKKLEEAEAKQAKADAKKSKGNKAPPEDEEGRFSAVGTTHRFGYRQRPRAKKPSRIFLRGLVGLSSEANHKADGPLEEQAKTGPVDMARTFGAAMLFETADGSVFTTGVVLRAMSWRRDVELLSEDRFSYDPSPRNLAFDLALSFKWGWSFAEERGHAYLSVPIGITIDVLSDDFDETRDFDIGPGWNVGADVGLAWFFTKGFGVTLELGYLWHNFFHAYRMEDAVGSGRLVYTLDQRMINTGLVFRL